MSPKHKVNLGSPDKVILIDIFKVRLPHDTIPLPEAQARANTCCAV